MQVKLKINDVVFVEEVDPSMSLLNFLREKGFYSVKCGCETSSCGLCTVWVDGKPILSCTYPLMRANGKNITTLEGLEKEALEFGGFLADEGSDQCGYCNTGFIMNVLAMVRELDNPTEESIREYLEGNLCRCSGYMGQLRAIAKYLKMKKGV